METLLVEPPRPAAVLVLAHGAGAGMRHPFLEGLARALAGRGIATLRYEFGYMAERRRRVDPPAVATARVREAVEEAARAVPGVPLLAGGKSFGGRMTSQAQAERPLPEVRGLVFVGFPLHPPARPGTERAEHLQRVSVPMLFLQGTRDTFARRDLLEPVVAGLAPRARLVWTDGGDHSFAVRGRPQDVVLGVLAETVAGWATALLGPGP
jgi:hypothetical protein